MVICLDPTMLNDGYQKYFCVLDLISDMDPRIKNRVSHYKGERMILKDQWGRLCSVTWRNCWFVEASERGLFRLKNCVDCKHADNCFKRYSDHMVCPIHLRVCSVFIAGNCPQTDCHRSKAHHCEDADHWVCPVDKNEARCQNAEENYDTDSS
jgi:hypothetical protein